MTTLLALSLLGCVPLTLAGSEPEALITRYRADRGAITRFYTFEGSHERRARLERLAHEYQAALARLPFDALDVEDRADVVLLGKHLEHELGQLERARRDAASLESLLPFANGIAALEEQRRALVAVEPKLAAEALERLSKEIEAARKSTDECAPSVARLDAHRAAQTLDALKRALAAWHAFSAGYDASFSWWTKKPFEGCTAELEAYARLLRDKIVAPKAGEKEAILGVPIGREALLAELDAAFIPYSPEELVAIADREMAWCTREMLAASNALGCGDDWKQALEQVKQQYVEPGQQPRLVAELAQEAIAFIEARDLLTIPPLAKEVWRMEMMSPERQLLNPYFLGGEEILVSYPTDAMTHAQKLMSMRANNRHFSRAVVHHELIPGHHLQGFMTDRYRPYRELFNTPFWIEGWALYWEMLLWDQGFAKSPEDKIGMLFWRMHRCARIRFSLGFHLGTLTPEQCIEYLVEAGGQERDSATAEVKRSFVGGYSPLYQAAYMLGGLQFRALYKELVDGKKLSARQFHDAVLQGGPMPVEVIRARLGGTKLARDFKSSWRFYALD